MPTVMACCPRPGALMAEGADYFGVAYLTEGMCLRQAGMATPILLLMGIMPAEAAAAVAADLEVALFRRDIAASLAAQARQQHKKARVHLKIDTGMGRLGLLPGEVRQFLDYLAGLPELEVAGLISHFAESDVSDQSFTVKQLRDFDELLQSGAVLGLVCPCQPYCQQRRHPARPPLTPEYGPGRHLPVRVAVIPGNPGPGAAAAGHEPANPHPAAERVAGRRQHQLQPDLYCPGSHTTGGPADRLLQRLQPLALQSGLGPHQRPPRPHTGQSVHEPYHGGRDRYSWGQRG